MRSKLASRGGLRLAQRSMPKSELHPFDNDGGLLSALPWTKTAAHSRNGACRFKYLANRSTSVDGSRVLILITVIEQFRMAKPIPRPSILDDFESLRAVNG